MTGLTFCRRLKNEGLVSQYLRILETGNCRRFLQLIQRMKDNKPMCRRALDITISGDPTDYTQWSIYQVQTWANNHGFASVASLLAKHEIAGDVLDDLNLDFFFTLSEFPFELQDKFEEAIQELRNSGQ